MLSISYSIFIATLATLIVLLIGSRKKRLSKRAFSFFMFIQKAFDYLVIAFVVSIFLIALL